MFPPRAHLLTVAAPALAGSAAVLVLADLGSSYWAIQGLALGLALTLAVAGSAVGRRAVAGRQAERRVAPATLVILVVGVTLCGLAAPLLSDATRPERWVSVWSLRLYVAPILLPSFIAASAALVARQGPPERLVLAAFVGAVALLAVQPDASQALALLAAGAVVGARHRTTSASAVAALGLAALLTAWTFTQPDPLAPVSYVEGVFALAFDRSVLAGVAVVACAVAFVVGLYRSGGRGYLGLPAVAAYYTVLFGCSVAGLTPAPLVGFGASPWLGFGLLVAVASWVDAGADLGYASARDGHAVMGDSGRRSPKAWPPVAYTCISVQTPAAWSASA